MNQCRVVTYNYSARDRGSGGSGCCTSSRRESYVVNCSTMVVIVVVVVMEIEVKLASVEADILKEVAAAAKKWW